MSQTLSESERPRHVSFDSIPFNAPALYNSILSVTFSVSHTNSKVTIKRKLLDIVQKLTFIIFSDLHVNR